MAQWEFVDWLLLWLLETSQFDFEWDDGNRTKNAKKHGVFLEEVESVFRIGLALPLGIQIAPKTTEQRLGIVGPGGFGRLLQVAFCTQRRQGPGYQRPSCTPKGKKKL